MLKSFYARFLLTTWHLSSLYTVLLALIMAGAVIISAVEKVSFGTAVYFSFITGLTVGYGDIVPTTAIGRVISVLLSIVGILFTGLVVAGAVEAVRYALNKLQGQD